MTAELQISPSGLTGHCAGCRDSSAKTPAQASSAVRSRVIAGEVGVVEVTPLPPVEIVLNNSVLKVLVLLLLVTPPVVDEAAQEAEEDDGKDGHGDPDVGGGHTLRGVAGAERPYGLVISSCVPTPVTAICGAAEYLGIGVSVLPGDIQRDPEQKQ